MVVKMKLHQLFKINFSVGPQPDQNHQFSPVLDYVIESIFGGPPEAVTAGKNARTIFHLRYLRIFGFDNADAVLNAELPEALRCPLHRRLACNFQQGWGQG